MTAHTTPASLTTLADELHAAAKEANAGRAARTVHGGAELTLRQTVIALVAGRGLDEHESPGEATLQVIRGDVRLEGVTSGSLPGTTGDLLTIPDERHSLAADTDSVVLLTVVAR